MDRHPAEGFPGRFIKPCCLVLLGLGCVIACGFSAHAQVDLPCPAEYELVPADLLNPVFSNIFDIALSWDLHEKGHAWNLDSLRAFADYIIDDLPANNDDLVSRLVAYFSEDLDPDYAGITIPCPNGSYSRFHICIREEVGDIHGAGNRVSLANFVTIAPDEERVLSARELATEGFAHEWQHVLYEAIAAGPKFNGRIGTNEFLSKAAEYLAGMNGMWPVHDMPYERSFLGGRDYFAECVANGHADHKYASFALFAAYLLEHFSNDPLTIEDDLLHCWLNYEISDIFGNRVNQITPESLAALLAEPLYASYFDSANGPGRLEELFHEFMLSLWVNSPSLRGEATVWARGLKPQEQYQLFTNVNSIDCADDAYSLPLVTVAGLNPVSVTGPVWPTDIHRDPNECSEGIDSRDFPRYPQISTYGVSYLPVVADRALLGTNCYRLKLNLHLEDEIFCHGAGQVIAAHPSQNLTLNVSVLAYPQAHDSLDLRGLEVEELATRKFNLGTLPQDLEFTVPCFASTWQAVVLALSVTERMPSHGYVWNRIFPFSYDVVVEPEPSPAFVLRSEVWGGEGEDICLDGDLQIAAGARLRIAAGSRVAIADPAMEIRTSGQLHLDGDGQSPVLIESAVGNKAAWGGIRCLEGGELTIEDAIIRNGLTLDAQAMGRVAFHNLMWDSGIYPATIKFEGALTKVNQLWVRNCEHVSLTAGRLDSCTFIASPGLTHPLLDIDGAAIGCSYMNVINAAQGIRVAGAHITMGPEVNIVTSGSTPDSRVGLELAESARMIADGIRVDGFPVGIKLSENSTCIVRNSVVSSCSLGVSLAGSAGPADFGTTFLGDVGWGGNRFLGVEDGSMAKAIDNRSPFACLAQMNYWGTSPPSDLLFSGNVSWQPYSSGFRIAHSVVPSPREAPAFSGVNLESVWPNPFNPRTNFTFSVEGEGQCLTLHVFDVTGHYVACPIQGNFSAGRYTRAWDACDLDGRQLPSGVYFARFEGEEKTVKVVLLH
ncbi:MAG: hypothetical protein GY835_07020 [bacterium]|nr:hypothetical protein [bacterium]